MTEKTSNKHSVIVIGAGPAGIFAAREIAEKGVDVGLLNRDIKPGGLAEYGIFHNKYKMKNGLRRQFSKSINEPNLHYFGNVSVGDEAEISLKDLQDMGFDAIVVAVGAQGTKWLGLPGEELQGVFHAKDLVYHYNKLPPYSLKEFPIGERVACIGVGNVMMDIAHWTIRDLKVKQVTAVARRGPADVKFTKKEMSIIIRNLDQEFLDAEIARTKPILEAVNQNPQLAIDFILSALNKSQEPVSETVFKLDFLASPRQIHGDETSNVTGLEVEDTTLELRDDGITTKAVGLGTTRVIEVDTVVFCIGDRVDPSLGLPLDKWKDYAKHPQPKFPQDGHSYEAFNPETNESMPGVFLTGWAREASTGLVGAARKDGTNAADAVLQYLETLPSVNGINDALKALKKRLGKLQDPVVTESDIARLEEIEKSKAEELGLPEFKFKSNQEMLQAMGVG